MISHTYESSKRRDILFYSTHYIIELQPLRRIDNYDPTCHLIRITIHFRFSCRLFNSLRLQ